MWPGCGSTLQMSEIKYWNLTSAFSVIMLLMSYEAQVFCRIYLGKQFVLELNTFGRSVLLHFFPLCEYLAKFFVQLSPDLNIY